MQYRTLTLAALALGALAGPSFTQARGATQDARPARAETQDAGNRQREQIPQANRPGARENQPAVQRAGAQGARNRNPRGEAPQQGWTDRQILGRMAREAAVHNERMAELRQVMQLLRDRGTDQSSKLRQVDALMEKERARYESLVTAARNRIGRVRFDPLWNTIEARASRGSRINANNSDQAESQRAGAREGQREGQRPAARQGQRAGQRDGQRAGQRDGQRDGQRQRGDG